MRKFACLLCLIQIGSIFFIVMSEGLSRQSSGLFLTFVFAAAPIVSIAAMVTGKDVKRRMPELFKLELEARKAVLRRKIAAADSTTAP